MARFGVTVEREGWQRFTVAAGSRYVSPGTIYVEGDASSASYFLAPARSAAGPVRVEGVGRDSIQGDVKFAEALAQMGARIEMGPNWIEARAPAAAAWLRSTSICNHIPDAAMTLAVAALFADGTTHAAQHRQLAGQGNRPHRGDGDRIAQGRRDGGGGRGFHPRHPGRELKPAAIDTYDDHRMAMCFSLAALGDAGAHQRSEVRGQDLPGLFRPLRRRDQAAPVIAIDGPSASGKGTVAERVAAALGLPLPRYRRAVPADRAGGAAGRGRLGDEAGVAAIAAALDVEFSESDIRLAGETVGDAIRTEEISAGASKVAALPAVRAALLFRQRAFGTAPGLVGDGRDMGSVVFPARDAQGLPHGQRRGACQNGAISS